MAYAIDMRRLLRYNNAEMKRLREWWRKLTDAFEESIDYDVYVSFQKWEQDEKEERRKLREFERISKRLPKLIAELESITEKLRSLAQ